MNQSIRIEDCSEQTERSAGASASDLHEYMIEVAHDPTHQECRKFFESLLHAGVHFITRAHWGCDAGVHTGWLVVRALDDCDAALMVPPALRHKAKVVRFNRFTADDLRNPRSYGRPADAALMVAASVGGYRN